MTGSHGTDGKDGPGVALATAMEAARVRSAHTAAVQAQQQQRLEEFQKICKKRAMAIAPRKAGALDAMPPQAVWEDVPTIQEPGFQLAYCDGKSWVDSSPSLRSFDELASCMSQARKEALRCLTGPSGVGCSWEVEQQQT
ncbi:unnamed protein product [Cladocopium goreaui]|uniref:Uncharacterized protein n=1 Tax=Cladocopium goreaui TaxID=2562237 RepID=A0A9P1BIN4_9DINO|nr:unnamed protein product [Cladocopium goreaui]